MRSPKILLYFAVGTLLSTSVICADRFQNITSRAQSNDEIAIRGVVQKFFELYQQKDLDRLFLLWSEKSTFLAENKKNLHREFTVNEKIVAKGINIQTIMIAGDQATLRMTADLIFTKAQITNPTEKIEKKNRTIHLLNEGGTWKVWKFVPTEEEMAKAIIAAKTEEERNALIEKEPDLITTDLTSALIHQTYPLYMDQGQYQHALTINLLAYQLAERIGDKLQIATRLIDVGDVYRMWENAPPGYAEIALEYYEKSLKIGEEFGFKKLISNTLIRCGIIYQLLGELSLATGYYQRCIKLSEELGDSTQASKALNNLGLIYQENSNYAKALELQLRGLKYTERDLGSGTNWSDLALTLGNIGTLFQIQGNTDQALAYLQKSLEAAEKGFMAGDINAKGDMALALESIGAIYLQQSNQSSALENFQKSQTLAEGLGNGELGNRDEYVANIKIDIGDALAGGKSIPQAITYYDEAFKVAENGNNRRLMSMALWRLAKTHLSQGNNREALTLAEKAINNFEQNSLSPILSQILVTTAGAYRNLGQPEKAHEALVRAINTTEQLREQVAGREIDRQRYFENAVRPYQVMIDLLIDQRKFHEAFSYAQQAKGRILLELLRNGRANISKSMTAAEKEQDHRLNRQIVLLNRQITDEKLKPQPDQNRLAEFEEQLKKARLEFDVFQTSLYALHPELKVQHGEILPISLDATADLVPNSKTAVLEFIVTDENVQLFVLTRESSAQVVLNTHTVKIKRQSLSEMVERFRRRLANRDFDFQGLSRELYDLLLKPAQKQLQNKTSLIISPDHILWDLPFQVLQPQEGRYLIEEAAISYAPSLSVLKEMHLMRKHRQNQTPLSLLALGNPLLGKQSIELAKFVLMNDELHPLPEAGRQIQALERLYGKRVSKAFTGPAAREEVVKQESSRYRILHLATHGVLNDTSPMYSHVMLSQTPGKNDEDGLLEAWEIMNLELKADLVVLSACETARGRVGAGEGVIGLTWAFFVAGCPTTVVSQWKVESSSTTELMVEFHKRFKTQFDKSRSATSTAESLREAALKLMRDKEYRHPFFWGGFVVVGDGS